MNILKGDCLIGHDTSFYCTNTRVQEKMFVYIQMFALVKMPTIGCILTSVSMINTAFESSKARKVNTFQPFTFCGRFKFHVQFI